jgi:hypothetical protein
MRSEGGSDDESNLITLCTACHATVHGRDVTGEKAGTVIGIVGATAAVKGTKPTDGA